MKKIESTFLSILIILIFFYSSCNKNLEKSAITTNDTEYAIEFDHHAIENSTGCQFNILKAKTLGYIPLHKFYWISLENKIPNQKLEELADAIIKETIKESPKTYHSFTLHFLLESELLKRAENLKCFARATFLPEGSWGKVGRVAIENYEDYQLTCQTFE